MLKHSGRYITHRVDYSGYLMIDHFNPMKLPLYYFFPRCHKALSVNEKGFWFFSFLIIIDIFYLIEADSCINPKYLSLVVGLPL